MADPTPPAPEPTSQPESADAAQPDVEASEAELARSIEAFERAASRTRRRATVTPAEPLAPAPAESSPRRPPWASLTVTALGLILVLVFLGRDPAVSEPAEAPPDETATSAPAAPPGAAPATPPAADDVPAPEAAPAPDVEPPPVVEPPAAPEATDGGFDIQVGSYDREDLATTFAERLTTAGYAARVVQGRLDDGRVVYRVRVGGYPDRTSATAAGERLQADQGLDWFLVSR